MTSLLPLKLPLTQTLCPFEPSITVMTAPLSIDHLSKYRVAPDAVPVPAASSLSDSLLPTPSVSGPVIGPDFGYPVFTPPEQFAAPYRVRLMSAVTPFGATDTLTLPSVKPVVA